MKPVYYNEHDLYAAQWLRNLIAAGHIAPGDVDTRSIEDVQPDDLKPYTQCHFFAGIGVWSYALRRAGWPDDRRIWTMSCPCQPFSEAGEGLGFADERHLWPAAFHLVSQCRPAKMLGEQVASKNAGPWVDLVHTDLEALDYAFGSVPFPAASVGAPHIRDRIYWVADAFGQQHSRPSEGAWSGGWPLPGHGLQLGGLADARHDHDAGEVPAASARQQEAIGPTDQPGGRGVSPLRVGDPNCESAWRNAGSAHPEEVGHGAKGSDGHRFGHAGSDLVAQPSPLHGFWRDADWLLCRDGKWRPVEPGTFPLVDGSAARVGRGSPDWHAPAGPEGFGHRAGRLKGYGNAICAEAAVAFIECLT